MKKILLGLVACTMLMGVTRAQNEICGYKEYFDRQVKDDPATLKRMQEIEEFTKQYIANYNATKTQGANAVVTIPVVFHVVYKNTSENLPLSCFQDQILQLNRDYRYQNTDKSSIPGVFASLAADCEIEFCLAQRDPQGQATTGVTYTSTTDPSFSADDQVKYAAQGGHDIWDVNSYLNIWVCDIGGNVLGYGLFPGADPLRDGVVVDYTTIGSCSNAPYHMGRTVVHEVGHWLNLRHIWGDANCGDDFVNDTPTQQTQNAGAPSFPHVTCNNGPNGDMFMNYMDYSDHASLLMFTLEQKKRMHAALAGPRKGLMNSNACAPPTSNKPVANFSTATPKVLLGSTVSFFDQSLNNPTGWVWTFSGAATTSSNAQNPSGIQYNTLGCFPVTLVATNANGSDTKTKICYVNVVRQCDTLSNVFQGDTVVYYGSDNWGYMTGHNGYGVTAIADKFTNPSAGTYKMEGVYIGVAYSKYGNSAKTVNVKVYNANGTSFSGQPGAPGTQLGSTTTLTYSELGDGRFFGNPVYARFATPVTVSSSFYVSVEYTYAAGDTLALLCTKFRSNHDSTAWEKWSNGTWHPFTQQYWWNSKFSMVYNPVLCDQLTSVEDQVPFSHLISVYPNPGSGLFTVGFGFESAKNVTLNVYNLIGERVHNEQLFAMPASSRQLDLNKLPDGVYLMEVRTENNATTQKIILQH